MPVSEAQKRAVQKYNKEKTHSFTMRFFPKDGELWGHLQKQPRKAEYIKGLIRKDMDGTGAEEIGE